MTLSVLPNFSGKRKAVEGKYQMKDARKFLAATAHAAEETAVEPQDWRLQRLQSEWRALASEWLALTAAVEQFEREFESLEENFSRHWKRAAGVNGERGLQIDRNLKKIGGASGRCPPVQI